VRQGYVACLYGAVGIFAVLSLYLFRHFVIFGVPAAIIRCTITTWTLCILCRAIPAMHLLRHSNAFPLQMSRYGKFFLHRHKHNEP
jgi:hypothetical protein